MNLGYACINTELRKKRIFGGRTCRKQSYTIEKASQLALQNITDIHTILKWNEQNGIRLYRMPSDLFPWMSEYELSDLPDYKRICQVLSMIGQYAQQHDHRLTFHPGPFNILGSKKPDVVKRTIKELNQHSQVFDLMGYKPCHYNKINIHVGAAYKNKVDSLKAWQDGYNQLDEKTKLRLTLENDDKPSMFVIEDLVELGVPLVFDYHHHACNPGKLTQREALSLAVQTWPDGIKPIVHYSSARQLHEDKRSKIQAHADYVYSSIDLHGFDVDVVLEAKMKEQAVLQYRKNFSIVTI